MIAECPDDISEEELARFLAGGTRYRHLPEHRKLWAALTEATADAQRLIEDGFSVTVEESPTRIIPIEEYLAARAP